MSPLLSYTVALVLYMRPYKFMILHLALDNNGFLKENIFLPNGTKGWIFIYLNKKGGMLPRRPAIKLAFSISQQRRFLGG